ncbi:MAG TPA: CmcJ/NvfI family oxidoreductase [Stellaceae bacterium]|nr:CmcJ/NvfI family oxidoreductase [Stellaceae bacterium]
MDGLAPANLKGIVASLNFTAPMDEKPYSYNYDPGPGIKLRNTENEEHTVNVYDGRGLDLSLDREGFALVHHKTAANDLYGEEIIRSVYYPECEALMKKAAGAKKVVAFDHIVRNAAKSAPGSTVKMPAGRVHNDYTAWSAPQRVRDLMGDEATELLKHRFAVNNVWRPIAGPLLRSPLVLCDSQTLDYDNLLPSDLRYPDRTGETYAVTYNPNQRWFYFPEMQPDEAILISCYDSGRRNAARFSAHGAFDDPNTPANAPPRESIEVRTLVFF